MWVCRHDGNTRNVQKDEVAPVADNMKIDFGPSAQAVVHSDK